MTSPKNGARLPATDDTIEVTGSATDRGSIAKAEIEASAGDAVLAEVAAVKPGQFAWRARIAGTPGENVLRVRAVDSDGNESKTAVVRFRFVKKQHLAVLTWGFGRVTPGSGEYEVNEIHRFVATSAPGWRFSEWRAYLAAGILTEQRAASVAHPIRGHIADDPCRAFPAQSRSECGRRV